MKIGVIGVGHMGSLLAKVLAQGDASVLICDHNQKKIDVLVDHTACIQSETIEICDTCDVIIMGMRPQDVSQFLDECKHRLQMRQNFLLVTMAAGVGCETIQKLLNFPAPVMRIMPNAPIEVGFGAIPYCLAGVTEKNLVSSIMSAFEKTAIMMEIEEDQMDAVCALSGSGPAFVYRFIEALVKAGESCGLDEDVSRTLATQTVLGASMLAKDSCHSPNELTQAVCSPGGTTIEGVNILDKSDFNDVITQTVFASFARSKELS